jgi:glycosyltransferase involved in cell wall biosynthesis/GT2 family glycosyltransferase
MTWKWIDYLLIAQSGLFDARYYLRKHRDVRLADVDPILHYLKYGWKEGRNPSRDFNTTAYLTMYPDVRAAQVNPLVHYIRFGKKEGRSTSYPGSEEENPDATTMPGEQLPKSTDPGHTSQPPIQSKLGLLTGILTDRAGFSPKVTVIVPNYNHAPYLEQRLESIYNQTYRNIEVLLLDDCSTDHSPDIIKKYQTKYPDITRCDFNSVNSGSPLSQWKKGISLAKGDLIWIAESDDYCDKDFLEKLVQYFVDESILLSYAHTVFIDPAGENHAFTFETYVSQIDSHKWEHSYINSAHGEVNHALGLLNTIPNVSSAVFRRIEGIFPLFNDPDWEKMQVCGDWIFYLNLIQGGRIAYCREINAYYRIHEAGSSKKNQTRDIYYQEHEKVSCAVASLYRVPDELLIRHYRRLKDYYLLMVADGSVEKFDQLYDMNKIFESRKKRNPNVLIGIYGFVYGGGEIIPIRLANALREKGVSVTLLNGNHETFQQGVRDMLHSNIPVISMVESLDGILVLKELGIEIVHTHHAAMESYFANAKLKAETSVKHIVTMHGMYELMDNFYTHSKHIRENVDFWFYTANKNIEPFKKIGMFPSEKFAKIDNGLQAPQFHPVDLSALGIQPDSFTACIASRAMKEKGWFEAIEAIEKARAETKKDIHLILIGEGPIYKKLKQRRLPSYIHVIGAKPNVCDYLVSAQLGLLPTYFKGESFPMVLLECFMSGKPVVVSNIGEIPNMITAEDGKKAGLLIELHDEKVDPDELAAALVKISSDQVLYEQCSQAVRLLQKRFDVDRVADRYLGGYKQVAGM